MPVPVVLRDVIRTSALWDAYFWLDDSGPIRESWAGCQVTLLTRADAGFVLDIGAKFLGVSLSLRHRTLAHDTEIAWDDQAHWVPNVLRWPELIRICERVSSFDVDFDQGLVLLLLCRFCPITSDEDASLAEPMLQRAWQTVGATDRGDAQTYIDHVDRRAETCGWRLDKRFGWVLDDEAAYSCRNSQNPKFPFDALNDIIGV